MINILTDEQCEEFRRMPGSFHKMVRAIYAAGVASVQKELDHMTLVASLEIKHSAVWQAEYHALNKLLATVRGEADDALLAEIEQEPVAYLLEQASGQSLRFERPSVAANADPVKVMPLYAAPQPQGEQCPSEGPAYGIIDPDYARLYTIIRLLAWQEGYAIGMHGSFTRDLDLIAVPWAERVCEPEHLIRRILSRTNLKEQHGNPGIKSHGRLAWTLLLPEFGDPRWVDLSIMPKAAQPKEPT